MLNLNKTTALTLALACILAVGAGFATFNALSSTLKGDPSVEQETSANLETPNSGQDSIQTMGGIAQNASNRPQFFTADLSTEEPVVAQVEPFTIEADLSNVINKDDITGYDAEKLVKNGFHIQLNEDYLWNSEFFNVYEFNRYFLYPSFITTDSMMHTYHLYFAYLLKTTERNYLYSSLLETSQALLSESQAQLAEVAGTPWEEAALRNVAFFAIGTTLLNADASIPAEVQDVTSSEVSKIMNAEGIDLCAITNDEEDYTQYKPRGYYAGDEQLERYFRTMMWFGRINFTQKDESLDRSAALITLALNGSAATSWEAIYAVTSFFAGTSDDNGYYEYIDALISAWGNNATAAALAANEEGWNNFHTITASMPAPVINSILVDDEGPDANHQEEEKGFRFMGQRFSFDAAIFQKLIYSETGLNAANEKRMLPNALDVPAAMGSDEALSILEEVGETQYANYSENMAMLREGIASVSDATWAASLYNQWLYTLQPLLDVKPAGWPQFMQSKEWMRKNLQSYLGSYTELKHDTVLYSKQVAAEFGGGIPERDDRGYVEPEPELYGRLASLTKATSEGLDRCGIIDEESKTDLELLDAIAEKLKEMSLKELRNEVLTEDEYEFIRSYGGQLEHFWKQAWRDEITEEFPRSSDYPSAIVTDVATNADGGTVLEIGTGNPGYIFVVVPVDGTLRIARGAVFSFYQFEQPMNQRLTDTEWREKMGLWWQGNADPVSPEEWTTSFMDPPQSY